MEYVIYNGGKTPYIEGFEVAAEIQSDDLNALQLFFDTYSKCYVIGVLSYDLLNTLPVNENIINTTPTSFVVPKYIKINAEKVIFYKANKNALETISKSEFEKAYDDWNSNLSPKTNNKIGDWISTVNKNKYFQQFEYIQEQLQMGNIYEMNYCVPFVTQGCLANSYQTYRKMQNTIQAPFSGYFKSKNTHLLSFSPERYIVKKGQKLTSQPIKGTSARFENSVEDGKSREYLKNSPKEQSENVMIVDLVRNDLSKIAQKNSVNVDELFGIYSFSTVHQMISTISCTLKDNIDFTSILRATFPMGSMTGAPKVSAMKIIQETEDFQRGWYSGALGYIAPNGDFDFNVVIRSIIYDSNAEKLLFPVGGAITIQANAEDEYKECLLKFEGVRKVFDHES